MTVRNISISAAFAALMFCATPGWASSPDQARAAFARGGKLLAEGDFDAALKSFATAAKADAENQEYRQQYSLLRRVIKMRKRIEKEKNPEKWQASAEALRAFYYEHGVYTEALPLDRQVHAKQNTAQSAAMLAQTQLELGMNAEAADVLAGLEESEATPATRALLGIALARQGQLEQAKDVARQCAAPKDAKAGLLWDLARLHALLGDASDALSLLTRCFESIPPSRLDLAKTEAKNSKDFATLVASAEFTRALETKSKVKESSCSGGSSCGSCPSRSGCSKSSKSASSTKKP